MATAGPSDIGTSAPETTVEKTDTPGTEYVPTSPAGKGEKTAAANQRALPNSIDAEVCVLGSMMLDPGTIDIAVHITQGDDFFRPSHRVVYDALCGMHNSGKPIDLVTISEELQRSKLLERVGGDEYLVSLVESVPSAANIEYYAMLVRDKALLRSLIAANQQIIQDAYESSDDPAEILDQAEHSIFKIASRQIGDNAKSLESLLQHTFETLSAADGSMITGVATGYFKLDELTAGFQKSEMIVVAGRPSMGKTALALNMAEYMAVEDNRKVLLFSLEMSKAQLALRFLCARARQNAARLRRGNPSAEDWTHLQMAAGELEKAKIFIDDSAELNILRLRAKARRMAASDGLDCVFIDYLQLMSPMGRVDSRQQQIAEMSRGLKALSRELDIPVVVLSQLNRAAEGREGHRPRMSDLRESGAIEQDADVVILLHREDYYHRDDPDYQEDNKTDVIIAKQRNGPIGTIPLTFLKECIRFENYTAEEAYGF
ncbi:MAG: replicative DNA helicase [Phycisphaerae bacterium]|nr:replicative DNA helicase [Phycisphaerae bacterium]